MKVSAEVKPPQSTVGVTRQAPARGPVYLALLPQYGSLCPPVRWVTSGAFRPLIALQMTTSVYSFMTYRTRQRLRALIGDLKEVAMWWLKLEIEECWRS